MVYSDSIQNRQPFYDHFWSFFANKVKIYHKTMVQIMILRCLTCLNYNWIKSYNIKRKIFRIWFFAFLWKKKNVKLQLINGNFTTLSGHFFANYIRIFLKFEIQMVILRYLLCLNFDWMYSYNKILVKTFLFHAWMCIISGVVCQSDFYVLRRKPALVFSKWLFFQISLKLSWAKKSGTLQVKNIIIFWTFHK